MDAAHPTPAPTSAWRWMPLIVIGLAAVPNGIFIAVAMHVRPTKVEDHPWQASARHDAQMATRGAFAAAGHGLAAEGVGGSRLRAVITSTGAPPTGPLRLRLYRPDDPAADRDVPWADPARPLEFDAGRTGVWRVTLWSAEGPLADCWSVIAAPGAGP